MLTHYPDAKVRLLLAAPERANYYKYGNALPATQFEKYRKRGYDVGLQLVGDKGLTAVNEGQPGATCDSVCWGRDAGACVVCVFFGTGLSAPFAVSAVSSMIHQHTFVLIHLMPYWSICRRGIFQAGVLGPAREDGL